MVAGRGGGGAGVRRAVQPCRMPHALRVPNPILLDMLHIPLTLIPLARPALAAGPPIAYRYMKENINRRPSAPRPATTASAAECLTVTPNRHRAASPGMYTWASHGPWMRGACAYLLRRNARVYVRGSRSVSRNQKVQHVGYWLLPCGALWAPLRALETSDSS